MDHHVVLCILVYTMSDPLQGGVLSVENILISPVDWDSVFPSLKSVTPPSAKGVVHRPPESVWSVRMPSILMGVLYLLDGFSRDVP